MSHNPTEHVQEQTFHHAAHHHGQQAHQTPDGDHGSDPAQPHDSGWITAAALTAAFLAALAAIGGALATSHLTESIHKRIESNDQWNYFQSKSMKNYLLETKAELLDALDHPAPAGDQEKMRANEAAKTQTKLLAESLEKTSKSHLQAHETFELAATMFHIAIAMVAISVVAKRKFFWFVSMAVGCVGLVFFTTGIMRAPSEHKAVHKVPNVDASSKPAAEIGSDQGH